MKMAFPLRIVSRKGTPETRTEEEDRLVQMIEDIVLKVERVHF